VVVAKPSKKTTTKREMSEAQKEALERGRLLRMENAKKEKEAKARLKEQEKQLDNQMVEHAKRGIEARKKIEELKKQMEELAKEANMPEPVATLPEPEPKPVPVQVATKSEPEPKPEPKPVPVATKSAQNQEEEDEDEEEEEEEVKVVRKIAGKRRNGKKVILIDASIFEDDDEPVRVKRVGRRMVEPRRRADRRTRFVDEPAMEEEYYDDDDDDYEPQPRVMGRRNGFANELTNVDNLNQTPHHHSNPAPPLAPIQRQAISREQLKQENPLFSMIFG